MLRTVLWQTACLSSFPHRPAWRRRLSESSAYILIWRRQPLGKKRCAQKVRRRLHAILHSGRHGKGDEFGATESSPHKGRRDSIANKDIPLPPSVTPSLPAAPQARVPRLTSPEFELFLRRGRGVLRPLALRSRIRWWMTMCAGRSHLLPSRGADRSGMSKE